MKAHQLNDKCYCTVNGGHNPFNFDGVERESLDPVMAREALDFEVVKTPMFTEDGRKVEGLFCLTKSTDGSFVPSRGVSKTFEPIQHPYVFDYIMNEVAPQYPDLKLETCGTIYGGSTSLMTFKVGDCFEIHGDKSPQEMRLFVSNPTNGSGSLVMGFTSVRLFCQNQIAVARRTAGADGFRIVHTKSGPRLVGNAVKEIARQIEAAQLIKARCERLADIGVSKDDLERCLERIYPLGKLEEGSPAYTRMKKLRDAAVAEFEAGKTASEMTEKTGWTLFNSITYPIFNPEKVRESIDVADIHYRGMNGTTADRVHRILAKVEDAVAA